MGWARVHNRQQEGIGSQGVTAISPGLERYENQGLPMIDEFHPEGVAVIWRQLLLSPIQTSTIGANLKYSS